MTETAMTPAAQTFDIHSAPEDQTVHLWNEDGTSATVPGTVRAMLLRAIAGGVRRISLTSSTGLRLRIRYDGSRHVGVLG